MLLACPAAEKQEEERDTQGVDGLDLRAKCPDSPAGGFQILTPDLEGDLLRTHCTWFNPQEEPLGFPDEMCTTSGALLGMESAQFCTGTPVESK